MPVTLNATATLPAHQAAVTALNLTTLTVDPNGQNRGLVVQLSFDRAANPTDPVVISVTWDDGGTNQACTLITSANGTGVGAVSSRVELWGLVNPTPGN